MSLADVANVQQAVLVDDAHLDFGAPRHKNLLDAARQLERES